MSSKKIFVTKMIPAAGIKKLQDHGFVVEVFSENRPILPSELEERAQRSDALITMLTDKIDATFLSQNTHLKIITNFAVGLNNIDLEAATANKIYIGHTPNVLTEATAELTMGLLIHMARNFNVAHNDLINGQFKHFDPLGYLGMSLKNKTLGIIGMGRIGECVANMAHNGFSMNIIYHNRTLKDSPYKKVSLEELLKTSDFISLNCPLTPETHHLINLERIKLMSNKAILINTARGEVIDQDALVYALQNNLILAAGLDVTTPEPLPIDHPLLKLPNAYVLPHIGSATNETRSAMSVLCADNIIGAFNNEFPPSIINCF